MKGLFSTSDLCCLLFLGAAHGNKQDRGDEREEVAVESLRGAT